MKIINCKKIQNLENFKEKYFGCKVFIMYIID